MKHSGKWISDFLNDKLYVNFYRSDDEWGCVLVFDLKPESRIEFSASLQTGEVTIESLRVSNDVQRKGVGSMLFSGMLKIIDVMNSEFNFKVSFLYGSLKPYEAPFDEYEKSIPFYIRQGEKHGLPIQFYEQDGDTLEMHDISIEQAMKFVDTWKCGGFRYQILQ